ncbi:MAG: preprotein translocase subunit SecG [Rhodospirillaceae bacterium]|nr:preprotein translocase subunit SecG [Rhodospirillaceae bacterium]
MINVLLVIHLLIAIALIILILVQKSEGAAAGGGFSATAAVNAMMQPRARPNPITRTTTVLGICFFASSIGLALLAKPEVAPTSIFATPTDGPAVPKVNELPIPAIDPAAVPSAPPAAAMGESSAPAVPSVPQNP